MNRLLVIYQKCNIPPNNSPQLFLLQVIFSLFLLCAVYIFSSTTGFAANIAFGYTIGIHFFILLVFWKYNHAAPSSPAETYDWNPDLPVKFKLESIILKEFEYARETAAQAMNDRHSLVNFFLIITGVTTTAISSLALGEQNISGISRWGLVEVICLIFNLIGWFYFINIIRLRQSWHESAMAMNQIKSFFIRNGEISPEIALTAFRWQKHTLPKAAKKSTIFYYSALVMALISSISLSVAWISIRNLMCPPLWDCLPYLIGVYHFFFLRQSYSVFLDKPEGSK